MQAFSSCGEWGLLPCWGARASYCGGFSCCGTWAQLPGGMWNFPDQGLNQWPRVDRQTPNQWTTREVPDCSVLTPMSDPSQREGKWKSLRPSLQPHGILQARRLEWVNVPLFPNTGIKPRSPTLRADSLPAEPQGKPKNTGVGSLSLLQWIFPTQESNWGLLHCRWITNWAIREAQRGRKEMISWRWDSSLSAYQRF